MVFMSNFGAYIKKIRDSKGLTLNQAALYSGISAAQLSRIENGKRGVPKPQTIKKLSEAYKLDYEGLMIRAGYITSDADKDKNHSDSLSEKDEKDIAKRMEEIKKDLASEDGLMFNGEPMSEEAVESFLEAMEYAVRQTQRINKKYIPKKYRDKEND
jgi:HTH-type transcriptional regulator, competence development regulator